MVELENYRHLEGVVVKAVLITQDNIDDLAKMCEATVDGFGGQRFITSNTSPNEDLGGVGEWLVFEHNPTESGNRRFVEAFMEDSFLRFFTKIEVPV